MNQTNSLGNLIEISIERKSENEPTDDDSNKRKSGFNDNLIIFFFEN